MIINDSNLVELLTYAKAHFVDALDAALAVPAGDAYAEDIKFTTKRLNLAWLGSVQEMRQWVGPRVVGQIEAYGYSLEPVPWEQTTAFSRDELEDAAESPVTTGAEIGLPKIMQKMASKVALWQAKLASTKLAAGSVDTCFDGVAFFHASHPNGAGQPTFGNIDTSGDEAQPWYLIDERQRPIIRAMRKDPMVESNDQKLFSDNVWEFGARARAIAGYALPQFAYRSTKTLSMANIRTHMLAMSEYVDDNNSALAINPTVLLVGRSLRFKAQDVVEKSILSTGEENMGKQLGLRVVYDPLLA